jgi:hypothetical protein
MAAANEETTATKKSPTRALRLLLIDVINDLEWEGGDKILPQALQMAERLAALKTAGPATSASRRIYVNDNFGQWQSDFQRNVDHVLHGGVRGEPLARLLASGGRRLLCAQALALRLLRNDPLHPSGLPGGDDAHRDGHRHRHLRPLHGQRCLHARLQGLRAADCVAANEPAYHVRRRLP